MEKYLLDLESKYSASYQEQLDNKEKRNLEVEEVTDSQYNLPVLLKSNTTPLVTSQMGQGQGRSVNEKSELKRASRGAS